MEIHLVMVHAMGVTEYNKIEKQIKEINEALGTDIHIYELLRINSPIGGRE